MFLGSSTFKLNWIPNWIKIFWIPTGSLGSRPNNWIRQVIRVYIEDIFLKLNQKKKTLQISFVIENETRFSKKCLEILWTTEIYLTNAPNFQLLVLPQMCIIWYWSFFKDYLLLRWYLVSFLLNFHIENTDNACGGLFELVPFEIL